MRDLLYLPTPIPIESGQPPPEQLCLKKLPPVCVISILRQILTKVRKTHNLNQICNNRTPYICFYYLKALYTEIQ